jgi:pseudaminic acid cytidylyltransferase
MHGFRWWCTHNNHIETRLDMRIAIIPARGGSKRIPKKNIIPFCGKPMIEYALESVKLSGLFDVIHVSTDCKEIAGIVGDLGYPVDFMRDENLADDYTGLVPVMRWVLDQYELKEKVFDQICCVMPNAPLLISADLKEAFNVFDANDGMHPLLVFAKYPVPIEWAFNRGENNIMRAVNSDKLLYRSQDLNDAYYECGPFTIWKREHLQNDNPLTGNVLSYVMPRERAIDIDTLEDLAYAERLYQIL